MIDPSQLSVGQRIAELRRHWSRVHGERLTQPELARRVGVSRGAVAAWETDVQAPRGENLIALAEVLGTTPQYIMTGMEEEAPEAEEPPPEVEDLFANHDQIVKYLGGVAPPGQDQAVKRDILEGIRRAITATRPLPRWWHDLKERVDRGEL